MKEQIFVLRNLSDWEIDVYERLLSTFSLVILDESNDKPRWCLTKNESFTVKTFYKQLFKHEVNGTRFLLRQIWKATGLPRVSLSAWEIGRSAF